MDEAAERAEALAFQAMMMDGGGGGYDDDEMMAQEEPDYGDYDALAGYEPPSDDEDEAPAPAAAAAAPAPPTADAVLANLRFGAAPGSPPRAAAAPAADSPWRGRKAAAPLRKGFAPAKRGVVKMQRVQNALCGTPLLHVPALRPEMAAHVDRAGRGPRAAPAMSNSARLLPAPPTDRASYAVTLSDGARMWTTVRGEADADANAPAAAAAAKSAGPLLSFPMADLKRRADNYRRRRETLPESAAAAAAAAAPASPAPKNPFLVSGPDGGDASAAPLPPAAAPGRLWVDKHAPTKFVHLLSDELVNRSVLRAIKSWDPFVFKRPAPAAAVAAGFVGAGAGVTAAGAGAGAGGGLACFKCGQAGHFSRDCPGRLAGGAAAAASVATAAAAKKKQQLDALNAARFNQSRGVHVDLRPEYKCIMLHGPAGLGKTTLAHVAAAHAGYRPHEVNASDDRSAKALGEAVVNAMSSRTLHGDKRPNLIILDEIDGAEKSAVAVVAAMLDAQLKSHRKKKTGDGAAPKKGRGAAPALLCPIIVIANDPYAPNLRELRSRSVMFEFKPSASSSSGGRLVARLRAVASAEGLDVQDYQLSKLAEQCGNDVRACLNTLQFVSADAHASAAGPSPGGGARTPAGTPVRRRNVTAALSDALSKGGRDSKYELLGVCKGIFSEDSANALDVNAAAASSPAARTGGASTASLSDGRAVGRLAEVVSAFNDPLVLSLGLHQNLVLGYEQWLGPMGESKDAHGDVLARCSEWLSTGEVLRVTAPAAYSLVSALALRVGVRSGCRFASKATRLARPSGDFLASTAREKNRSIARSFKAGRAQGGAARVGRGSAAAEGGRGVYTSSAAALSVRSLALDALSPLLLIAAPRVQVLTDLSLPEERKAHLDLTGVMFGCGLTYVNSFEKGAAGEAPVSRLRLEPAIDQLCLPDADVTLVAAEHEGLEYFEPVPRPALPEDVKQGLASELSYMTMRRRFEQKTGGDDAMDLDAILEQDDDAAFEAAAVAATEEAEAGMEVRDTKRAASKAQGQSWENLFVRKAKQASDAAAVKRGASTSNTSTNKRGPERGGAEGDAHVPVQFKFQKGFTNAVRRPVYMSDLLG